MTSFTVWWLCTFPIPNPLTPCHKAADDLFLLKSIRISNFTFLNCCFILFLWLWYFLMFLTFLVHFILWYPESRWFIKSPISLEIQRAVWLIICFITIGAYINSFLMLLNYLTISLTLLKLFIGSQGLGLIIIKSIIITMKMHNLPAQNPDTWHSQTSGWNILKLAYVCNPILLS